MRIWCKEVFLNSLWEIGKPIIKVLFLFTILLSCKENEQKIKEINGIYTLTNGNISYCVSGIEGGRVISIKHAGQELLIQKEIHPQYYGATFWPSPQRCFWPPSPILDNQPYHAKIKGYMLTLTSENDSLTGFRFIKEFSIESDDFISIKYSIKNISDTIKSVAPWDVMRVPGGITLFPVKDFPLEDLPSNLDYVHEDRGIVWYTYKNDSIKRGQKLFATTSEGWLAHIYNNVLLVKTFPKIEVDKLPYLQGEIEIFLAPNSMYVELENHGAFTSLQPGGILEYRQKWFIKGLGDNKMEKTEMVKVIRRCLD